MLETSDMRHNCVMQIFIVTGSDWNRNTFAFVVDFYDQLRSL